MKILGFSLNKVSIEKKEPIKGKLEIKSNLNIDEIKREEINISDKPALKFDFTYSIDYSPNVAKVEIKGSVITIEEEAEAKEIIKNWKKKKFSSEIKIPLFNLILDKCNLKALQLEDELSLPIHLPLPKLQAQSTSNSNPNPHYAG